MTGGEGIDTFVFDLRDENRPVFFNGTNGHSIVGYQTQTAEHSYFREIERFEVTTGSGDDWVNGGSGDDVISTGAGNDLIGQSRLILMIRRVLLGTILLMPVRATITLSTGSVPTGSSVAPATTP
ncbi:hypothetical protein HED63_27375 [Ochrobactrum cytisi]|nr:hypothetical protein [Brucella cytisi]